MYLVVVIENNEVISKLSFDTKTKARNFFRDLVDQIIIDYKGEYKQCSDILYHTWKFNGKTVQLLEI